VGQLNVQLDDRSIEALERFSARQRTPVAWLLKDYIAYLLGGGTPVRLDSDAVSAQQLGEIAQHGGSFEWLADEPEIYTADDGAPL
jgi:hypothetical protein